LLEYIFFSARVKDLNERGKDTPFLCFADPIPNWLSIFRMTLSVMNTWVSLFSFGIFNKHITVLVTNVWRHSLCAYENNNQELWRPEQVLIVDSSSPPLNYDDGQCAICLGRSGSSRQEIRHSLWSRFLFEMSHPVVPNKIGMSDLHNYFIEFYCIIVIIIENLILLLGK
jgi:hypothetical protein